jgi:hypothetical protein
VLTGLVLLAVFGTLLVNADVAFADLLRRWGQRVSPAEIARALIALAVGLVAAVAAAYLVSARRAVSGDRATLVQTPEAGAAAPARPRFGLGTVEWGIPVAMLDLLFGVFVFVQFTVLFGGDEYVLGPGGPDYAVYARGGFLQLLMVTALTLAVVAVLAVWARRETAGQRLFLRLLAGPCAC